MTIAKKVLGQDSKHYNYNEDVIDRLFFNNLDTPYSSTEYKILTEDNLTVSSKSFYQLNSLQYRSQEFYNVPEIQVLHRIHQSSAFNANDKNDRHAIKLGKYR